MKRNMMRTTARVIFVATMMIAFAFAFTAPIKVMADETEVGTVEKVAEVREEALAEKATSNTAGETESVEPVVEGATGAIETVKVQTVEEILAEIEAKNPVSAPAVEEEKVVEEAPAVAEVKVKDVIFEEGTTAEVIDEEEVADDVKVVSTATAPAANSTIITMSNAEEATATDSVAATYAEAEAPKVSNAAATNLQIVGGKKVDFNVIGRDTLFNHLQDAVDAGNICYPTSSMTTGVKYFAGHNPGTMSNMNTIRVGSTVRLSNSKGYQDYRIVEQHEYKAGEYSFTDVKFKNSKSGANLWAMIQNGTENGVVIQFCVKINGNTYYRFSYGQAI